MRVSHELSWRRSESRGLEAAVVGVGVVVDQREGPEGVGVAPHQVLAPVVDEFDGWSTLPDNVSLGKI